MTEASSDEEAVKAVKILTQTESDDVPLKVVADVPPKVVAKETEEPKADSQVKPAQCCGGGLLYGGGGCSSCGGGHCYPGREQCCWWNYDTCCGRIMGALHDCICCPDPCYEPHWVLAANAAFFQDGTRPVTQTRFRWDAAYGYTFPDTAEYFWAQIGNKGPSLPERRVDYQTLSYYQEIAAKGFSFFVEVPYIGTGPDVNPDHSGFSDINLGTKSMFLDCELLQMTFLFRTYIPVGSAGKGIGTGHTTLEPSLLATVKLAPVTYLQMQFAEWIPIGGDSGFEGDVFEYRFSLNHTLWSPNPGTALVGTFELAGLVFQDGAFTDPLGVVHSADGLNHLQVGPGLRFALCDRCDIGIGIGFGLDDHGPDTIYRTEFRLRF
jgi:hypothetical protein